MNKISVFLHFSSIFMLPFTSSIENVSLTFLIISLAVIKTTFLFFFANELAIVFRI